MPRPASKYPTELELQILKVLWSEAPLLARDVQRALAEAGRDLAKTSVITTLNTMVGKKYLRRKKQGNSFLFAPQITAEEVSQRVLDDVVDRVFDGSTSAVLLKLFDVKEVDERELKELRKIINRKTKAIVRIDVIGESNGYAGLVRRFVLAAHRADTAALPLARRRCGYLRGHGRMGAQRSVGASPLCGERRRAVGTGGLFNRRRLHWSTYARSSRSA